MKNYIKPKMNITEFEVEDVITTSGTGNGNGDENGNDSGSGYVG